MTSQTVLGRFGTESVCKTCNHLDKIEGRFYCKLLGAFLAEQTLYLPCDLKEPIDEKKVAVNSKS
jgi:hypothetical protein